ncbi:flagellar biosynthesis protein [Defluviimonas sp. WL0024]|uniref:Flagellar biosynthesis protein n=2 Tax=Albidovulum TaxID=205889 RepID=A0ABT3J2Y7_9RHOB|nr:MULTISPECIES: flagellar biosynthesis protein [Defluviimonas]MCU9849479.1 flagellar biosynthesis protein [Defluviimonas sp. WL0024]MCW3782045.1 flagellar biosynthesis protein [Defluviimonas salinarum]
MPRRVQLEVFELTDMTAERVELAQAELEECRLAAYEQGYAAGWDDAVSAQDAEVTRLRADLGRNLRDLSFTYHEAHSHVLRTLEPLLHDMVTKVLPAVARESLGQMVLEHLRPVAEELAGQPIAVVSTAANRAVLERLVTEAAPFPVSFREEPSLGDGQVYLRFGQEETRVDLDGVIDAISSAVSGFFQIEKHQEMRHG